MLQQRFHTAFLEGAMQKTLGSVVQYVHACLWVCSVRAGPSQSFELTFSCLFDLLLHVTGPDFNSTVQTSVNPPCVSLKNERKQTQTGFIGLICDGTNTTRRWLRFPLHLPRGIRRTAKKREGKGDEAETESEENKRAQQDVMLSCC